MDGNPLSLAQTLIKNLEKKNYLHQTFFISDDLRRAISPTLIANVLDTAVHAVPKHNLGRVSELITNDALLVFCVLVVINQVHLITEFQAHAVTDFKLPIRTKGELQSIAPELNIDAFRETQWQFIPWNFKRDALHVILPDDIILPFLDAESIGQGNGGEVSKVVLPSSLQSICALSASPQDETSSVTVARKIIKRTKSGRGTKGFNVERECLELYSGLRHPNIVPLLASYTFVDEHTMLFPFFPMDMESFLESKERFGCFNDDSVFIAAIVDLASALRAVHESNQRCKFTPALRTQYGYHHDIRPANILVTPTTFMLADFGLSRHLPPGEDLSREFIKNIGHYLAPESLDENWIPQQVGRAIDVWALGCLVSELATYMEGGVDGVKEFREIRMLPKFYSCKFENGYFFDGVPPTLRHQVSQRLAILSEKHQPQLLSNLSAFSRNMLQPDPASRPTVEACFLQLLYIRASHLFRTASSLLQEALTTNLWDQAVPEYIKTEGLLALSRLQAFGDVMGMNNNRELGSSGFRNAAVATFIADRLNTICHQLQLCKRTWADEKKRVIESKVSDSPAGASLPLGLKLVDGIFRDALDELCEKLSSSNQQHLSSLWRKELIESCRKNNSSLDNVERDINESLHNASYDSMEIHLRITRLEQALREEIKLPGTIDTKLLLDYSQIQTLSAFGRSHSLALFKESDAAQDVMNISSPNVLVEWVFLSQMGEGESERERVQKVSLLAGILSCPKPKGFRALQCVGFCTPDSRGHNREYGFVYAFPSSSSCTSSSPITRLRHLLKGAEQQVIPTLENKFRIAKALCSSVYELHFYNWLHRTISSENVIFFVNTNGRQTKTSATGVPTADLDDPYIIGFHHSRPDGNVHCSDIRSAEDVNPDAVFYQHPDYSDNNTIRFNKKHDYYSLGMVLLEIAYWRSCGNMWQEEKKRTRNSDIDRRAFKNKLVGRFVTGLAAVMGTAYMEAVQACFSPQPPSSDSDSRGSGNGFADDQDSQFFRNVVQKLDACFVG
ncbi:kinase-like domain-containing protein [Podospora fimiseda]|uniref:Kinase-like domain-containing protein n=1 Tax=Podospora fimiseda TaxID=252190 RepID=A0AAN7BIM5_9PEZI|nr:kinase-like domain-containing protein [Podospora fimiseda]